MPNSQDHQCLPTYHLYMLTQKLKETNLGIPFKIDFHPDQSQISQSLERVDMILQRILSITLEWLLVRCQNSVNSSVALPLISIRKKVISRLFQRISFRKRNITWNLKNTVSSIHHSKQASSHRLDILKSRDLSMVKQLSNLLVWTAKSLTTDHSITESLEIYRYFIV